MTEIARMIVGLGLDTGNFDKGLASSVRSIGGFQQSILRLAGVGSVAALFTAATKSALDFGDGMAEVSTLLSDTSSIDGLSKAVRRLSTEFGKSAGDEVKALYDIISAGATDATKAVEILTAANKLAVAGVTTVGVAADGLTTVLNAFGTAAGTAAEASDAMFVAVRAGKTTVEQLANSMAVVAPLAAAAGTSLEEVLAAAAALTAGGTKTTVAMTGLRAILAAIAKPSSEAEVLAKKLQINFTAAGLQSKGFAAFLKEVATATKGSTKDLAVLFGGVEALVPALALTGKQAAIFGATLDNMSRKAGETAVALAKMQATPGFQFKQLQQEFLDIMRDLGFVVLKVVVPAFQTLKKNWNEIRDVAIDLGKAFAVVGAAAAAFGVVLAGYKIGTFVSALASIAPLVITTADAFAFAELAVGAFWATALLPVTAIVAAIGLIALAFRSAAKEARDAAAAAAEFHKAAAASTPFQNATVATAADAEIIKLRAKAVEIKAAIAVAFEQDAGGAAEVLKKQLATIGTQIDRLKAQADAAREALTGHTGALTLPTVTITASGSAGIAKTVDQLDVLQKRVATLLAAEKQVGDIAGTQLPQLPAALVAVWTQANALLDRQKDKLSEVAVGARALIEALSTSAAIVAQSFASGALAKATGAAVTDAGAAVDREIAKLKPFEFKASLVVTPPDPSEIAGLQAAVQRVMDARGLAQIASFTGSSQFVKETESDLKQAELAFHQFATRAAADLLDPTLSAKDLQARITALAAAMSTVGASPKTGINIGKIAERIAEVANGARGLLDVARALGKIGDAAAQTTGDVINLVASLAQVTASIASGNLSGAISGLVGAIGSVLSLAGVGESPAQKEARKLQKENSERVAELTRALGGLQSSLGSLSQFQKAAANPRVQQLSDNARGVRGTFGDSELEKLHKQLAALGISYADLQAAARDLGIELRDSSGNLIKGAMKDLSDALAARIKDLTQFGKSLDDLRTKANLSQRVLGVNTGAAGDVTNNLDFLKSLAPDLFKKFFDGIDLGDANAVQTALRNLTTAFLAGAISAEDFADLLSKGDLESIILGVQDGLDALKDSANQATKSLLNIPAGLKLEALRFDNTDAIARGVAKGLGDGGPLTTTTTATTPITTTTVNNPSVTFTLGPGAIIVENGGTRTGSDVAADVLTQLQTQARARFGDSTRWWEIN